MLILLTNDDGVHSEGLVALKERLAARHDVYIVAPERERTCVGHAITLHKPLRIREVGDQAYASNGTPADCILLGVNVVLPRKPDFVLSGINKGPNMGQDVNYSGTVAAAKEGAFLGIPSLAVSICARTGFHFADAARYTEGILDLLKSKASGNGVLLNVNIPNLPYDNIKGFMVTRLGKRVYNETVFERTDPRGGRYYWIGGNNEGFEPIEGSDLYAVDAGYVSVTPLALDTTSESSIDILKKSLARRSL